MENTELRPLVIDPYATQFTIGDDTFLVEREARLSVARYRQLERYSSYAMLGRNANELIAEAQRAHTALNNNRPADAANLLMNFMNAVSDIENRHSPFLYICTLFMNRPDEDRAAFSKDMAESKIQAFQRAEIDFFLQQGIEWLNGFGDYSAKIIQLISKNSPLNQTL